MPLRQKELPEREDGSPLLGSFSISAILYFQLFLTAADDAILAFTETDVEVITCLSHSTLTTTNVLLGITARLDEEMQKIKAFKIGMIGFMIVLGSLASVMYALAYTEKREVLYANTIKIEGQEVMFRAFYLSAPAVLFEVKISVSKGTIKWTPHSAVMFEDTLGWFPCRINGRPHGTIQRWVCESDSGTVKWSVDPENVNMVWYLNFYNPDSYEKEVYIEVTKVWEKQNYQNWI